MIVIRLILHARNIRTALEGTGIGGLCKAIITMLIESCVLYAVSSLLVIAPWGASSPIAYTFLPILDQTQVRAFPWPRSLGSLSNVMTGVGQVIAPLLIIQRVANKSALTKKTLVSGRLSSFKARSRGELTGGDDALPDGDFVSSVDGCRVGPGELRAGV